MILASLSVIGSPLYDAFLLEEDDVCLVGEGAVNEVFKLLGVLEVELFLYSFN